jgi:exodeoxyribonuclease VII large subunit
MMSRNVYTPSALNREVRMHIEAGFPRLWLEGEISNLARPASGHLYFSLKDDRAQVRCALFKGNAGGIGFRPENGQQVQVFGRLSLYEGRGEFQMVAERMEAAGEGRLRAAFEALKKQLESEGLFDPAHKQDFPAYPHRIGVITSASGAVIRDIVQVLQRRWPLAQLRLYPAPVQGEEAPAALVAALQAANRHGWAQALIIGRGGGSLEDLWAFNNEALARAVFASGIPVVSAVGHESDYSITDFVADLRAPTPSAAAELLTPDAAQLHSAFRLLQARIGNSQQAGLQRLAQRLDELAGRLNRQHPQRRLQEFAQRLAALGTRQRHAVTRSLQERQRQLNPLRQNLQRAARRQGPELAGKLGQLQQRLGQSGRQLVEPRQRSLAGLARTLHAVSPLTTLNRGYAIVLLEAGEVPVLAPAQAAVGERIISQLAGGRIYSRVEGTSSAAPGDRYDEPDDADA